MAYPQKWNLLKFITIWYITMYHSHVQRFDGPLPITKTSTTAKDVYCCLRNSSFMYEHCCCHLWHLCLNNVRLSALCWHGKRRSLENVVIFSS